MFNKLLFGILFICTSAYGAQWHMINVNDTHLQGDAHLLEINGSTVLIDAGYENAAHRQLVPYLKNKNILSIDHFFVSHPHKDHYQGMYALLKSGIKITNMYIRIPDKTICDREIPWGCDYSDIRKAIYYASKAGVTVRTPKAGDIFDFGGSVITILRAETGVIEGKKLDVNDLSLIMSWKIDYFKVLFTGDLNKTLGTHLADDTSMKADFLKVPHHGGIGIAPDAFFDNVNAEYLMVPGPEWIFCGDRGSQVRTWAKENDKQVFVNGLNGHVIVNFEGRQGQIILQKKDRCSGDENYQTNAVDFTKQTDISHIIEFLLSDN